MNKWIMALALTASTSAAFAYTCQVDMVDRYNRVVKSYTSYDGEIGCKEGMKSCRLDIRTNPRLGGVDCVLRNLSPRPNPQPVPRPNPNPQHQPNPYPYPNPQSQYGVTVTGLMQDTLFIMSGRDASDLYYNCLTDIRRINAGSVDKLYFSINNGRFVSKSTSGWYNDTTICSILEQESRYVNSTYTRSISIVGDVEQRPFRINAIDRSSLLTNCLSEISSLRLGSADDMRYSLNGAPLQRLSTSGWWSTPAQVCKAMISHLDGQLH